MAVTLRWYTGPWGLGCPSVATTPEAGVACASEVGSGETSAQRPLFFSVVSRSVSPGTAPARLPRRFRLSRAPAGRSRAASEGGAPLVSRSVSPGTAPARHPRRLPLSRAPAGRSQAAPKGERRLSGRGTSLEARVAIAFEKWVAGGSQGGGGRLSGVAVTPEAGGARTSGVGSDTASVAVPHTVSCTQTAGGGRAWLYLPGRAGSQGHPYGRGSGLLGLLSVPAWAWWHPKLGTG